MKRKTSTTPTRIYTYGCLPPIDGREAIDDQLWRAHCYRNALVEVERTRRAAIADAQRAHDAVGPILDAIECVEAFVAEGRAEVKRMRAAQVDLLDLCALRDQIESARADLAVLRWLRGLAKLRARDDLTPVYRHADEQASAAIRELRKSDVAPYWGTYLVIEKSAETWCKQPEPPKFCRYDGTGRVAVQLQKGLHVAELEDGGDRRLRLRPGQPRKPRQRVKDTYRTVWLRVASNGRDPIWAKLPVVYHRPLPADGKIMWAWIRRTRVGVRYRYELQITVEAASFATPDLTCVRCQTVTRSGTVAIDIGQRDVAPDPRVLRVAAWQDVRGNRGEVMLPQIRSAGRPRREVPDDDGKADDLKGIRSRHLDEIVAELAAHKLKGQVPEAMLPRMQRLHAWRSPSRVALLRRHWIEHPGDTEIRALVDAYLKRDRHLADWECFDRRGRGLRRRELYRTFAADLVHRYSVVVLAQRDYRRARGRRPPEEATQGEGHDNRVLQRDAAPAKLRDAIALAAAAHGVRLIEVAIDGDTQWATAWGVCEHLLASADVAQGPCAPLASATPRSRRTRCPAQQSRQLGTPEQRDPLAPHDVTT